MGQQISCQSYQVENSEKLCCGGIYIELDKLHWEAGEHLTGRVHLLIESQFPGRQLVLEIQGVEHCKVYLAYYLEVMPRSKAPFAQAS